MMQYAAIYRVPMNHESNIFISFFNVLAGLLRLVLTLVTGIKLHRFIIHFNLGGAFRDDVGFVI
jgi:hypothetical protein